MLLLGLEREAQWSRELAALPEDMDLTPSTHMADHNMPVTPVSRDLSPS